MKFCLEFPHHEMQGNALMVLWFHHSYIVWICGKGDNFLDSRESFSFTWMCFAFHGLTAANYLNFSGTCLCLKSKSYSCGLDKTSNLQDSPTIHSKQDNRSALAFSCWLLEIFMAGPSTTSQLPVPVQHHSPGGSVPPLLESFYFLELSWIY